MLPVAIPGKAPEHTDPQTLTSDWLSRKVEMLLNELGLSAKNVYVDTAAGEHKSAEFTSKYNPNGRIPVFVDHSNNDFVIWSVSSSFVLEFLY